MEQISGRITVVKYFDAPPSWVVTAAGKRFMGHGPSDCHHALQVPLPDLGRQHADDCAHPGGEKMIPEFHTDTLLPIHGGERALDRPIVQVRPRVLDFFQPAEAIRGLVF